MEKKAKGFILVVLFCIVAIVIGLVVLFAVTTSDKYPVASTECGEVEGRSFEEGHKQVYEFLNIPYAAPPRGNLRWRSPQPLKGSNCWNGTLYYDDKVVMCPQKDMSMKTVGHEDCLILSVRTPSLEKEANLPVLVWIHGGGMIIGHSRASGYYPDNEFTGSMGIVTVSINYRLGIFGFLSLEDLWENDEYGNFAIMDQILALEWIQKNIKNFGGNAKDVTIFGNSGGGTATYSLLAASVDKAKDLFHKVIASSGAPNIHITKEEASREYKTRFLNKTACANVQNVSTCLRALSTEDVLSSSPINQMSLYTGDYEMAFPKNTENQAIPLQIIDTTVVKFSPSDIINQQLPSNYSMGILLGNMAQEPPSNSAPIVTKGSNWTLFEEYLEPFVSSFQNCSYTDLMSMYQNNTPVKFTPPVLTPYYIYSLVTADITVSCATTQLAYKLAQHPSFKVFSYIVSQPLTPTLTAKGTKVWYPEHTFDILPIFDFKQLFLYVPTFAPSESDIMLKSKLREMIRNFVHSEGTFEKENRNRTIEFWNATTQHTWYQPYHEQECDFLQRYGFLKHSWGNRGRWNS